MQEPDVMELPTREEVIEATEAAGLLAYEDGKRVRKEDGIRYVRCAICDAPAGEVTLVKVKVESVEAKTAAFLSGQKTEGYVCIGGDCAGQRNKALSRLFSKAAGRGFTLRLTKAGHALQWVTDKDGNQRRDYSLTSREVKRRKAVRKQQRASRRANRVS